jgi:LysR family transcriptional regulator for metE and metH
VQRIAAPPASLPPRSQLEVRDLELALALSAAGSTAGAASLLHLTQSAVSRALCQAEERIGVQLFQRSARGLSPTAAGQRLLVGAGALLQKLSELERAVAAPEQEPQRVRLVCECYTAYHWLPSATAKLRERWADLSVEVESDYTRDPVSALERGRVDIALLTTSALPKGGRLREQPLFADEVVFVMSHKHRLAKKRSLTQLELLGEPLITGATPPAEGRWFVRAAFGRRRPKLRLLRFPLTEAIMDAARAGMGVAVVSEWMASGYLERRDLVVRRLASGPLERPWRIAYREELTSVAERLKTALGAAVPRLRDSG